MVAIAVLTVFVYLLFVVWLMPFWNASLCARVALAVATRVRTALGDSAQV